MECVVAGVLVANSKELKTGNHPLSFLSQQKFKDFQVFILAGYANISKVCTA